MLKKKKMIKLCTLSERSRATCEVKRYECGMDICSAPVIVRPDERFRCEYCKDAKLMVEVVDQSNE